LRFGCDNKDLTSKPILRYSSIAKLVRKPLETVRRLISVGLNALKEGKEISPKKRGKLNDEHIHFISSEQTLKDWAHLSLIQRARMFHRMCPEIKISASLLQRTYKKLGIRYKFIQRGKKTIDYSN
jgi:hypothetical protein